MAFGLHRPANEIRGEQKPHDLLAAILSTAHQFGHTLGHIGKLARVIAFDHMDLPRRQRFAPGKIIQIGNFIRLQRTTQAAVAYRAGRAYRGLGAVMWRDGRGFFVSHWLSLKEIVGGPRNFGKTLVVNAKKPKIRDEN